MSSTWARSRATWCSTASRVPATTAAVAHKMGRRWVAVEIEPATFEKYALPRLSRVISGTDRGGITSAAGWQNGGGFRALAVADSILEQRDGLVLLSERATNGAFALAVCPQIGFTVEPDPPFVGRRGQPGSPYSTASPTRKRSTPWSPAWATARSPSWSPRPLPAMRRRRWPGEPGSRLWNAPRDLLSRAGAR